MQGRDSDIVIVVKTLIFKKIIASIIYITLLIIVSALAILYASGYRVNKNRIYKVSVVHFVSDPATNVIIDGIDRKIKTPKATYLEPGKYRVELARSGYVSQYYQITLGSGELFEREDISLFKSNIKPSVENSKQIDPSRLVDEGLAKSRFDLFVAFDHEIWRKDQLVTRLSDRLINVSYYTNQNYIIYQTDKYIGVINIDGSNNNTLFEYQTPTSLKIIFKNRGQTLEAYDGDKLIRATIQ